MTSSLETRHEAGREPRGDARETLVQRVASTAERRALRNSAHPQPTTTFASPSKQPNVELVLAEAIEPTPIDWLWDGWLAKGKARFSLGQPSTGKGERQSRFAAITSIGGVWPDGSQATAGDRRHLEWGG